MEKEEMKKILGEEPREPSFLVDDASVRSTDQLPSTDIQKVPAIDGVVCDVCGQEFTGTMSRAQLGRHKSAKHGIKSAKSAEPKAEDIIIPTSESYLGTLLKAFSIPNKEGILLAMQNTPNDLHRLKDMLRAVAVPAPKIEGVITLYSENLGLKPEAASTVPEVRTSPLKEVLGTMQDSLNIKLLQKMLSDDSGKESSKSEIESLKRQMDERDKKLEELLLKKETDTKIEKLEAEIKRQKEENNSQVGSVSAVVEKLIHELDKRDIQQQAREEMQKKDRIIEQMQTNTAAPLAEKMLNKVDGMLTNAGATFAKQNEQTIRANESIERSQMALALLRSGLTPEQTMEVIGSPKLSRPNFDIQGEYANLQKVNEAIKPKAPAQPLDPIEEATRKALQPIKMNAGQ